MSGSFTDSLKHNIDQDDICKIIHNGVKFRDSSAFDNEIVHTADSPEHAQTTVSAESIKKKYVENYVTKLEFVMQYVIDSKINNKLQRICFQLVKYAFPEKDDTLICSHKEGQHKFMRLSDIEVIQQKYRNNLILRVLKREGSHLNMVTEVKLEGYKYACMNFSKDGSMLALCLK